jgi:pimeloyl-ACP methyl ester carboxylesterase
MAEATINGFKMYYEDHSPDKEEAFLLIMGFTANATAWAMHVPFLAQKYRVVVFDNRGSGRSDVPEDTNAYTIRLMADDAAALLDHLGIARAHVLGVSMGGMIAQELAINHPGRVQSLILGCTTPGGETAVSANPDDLLTFLHTVTLPPEEAFIKGLPLMFSDDFLAANRTTILSEGMKLIDLAARPGGVLRQLVGCLQHDAGPRLGEIKAPTLVVTGSGDRIIDPRNSRILAERIPGAELIEYPGAGHGYQAEVFMEDIQNVLAFVARHSSSPPLHDMERTIEPTAQGGKDEAGPAGPTELPTDPNGAFAEINGFRMYYEDHGPRDAEAFLLIMGFTANATAWFRHIPRLAELYRVVAFDNRGAGRSESPEMAAYTMPQMADDAIALLDHLGIARAHVWGVSMGGMIAQEVALRHPDRVNTLILGCTGPGGAKNVDIKPEDMAEFFRMGTLPAEEAIIAGLPMLYSQGYIDANRDEIIERARGLMDLRAKPEGRQRQMMGIMQHDTYARLAEIKTPTLITTGTGDRICNPENSSVLAGAIPGARLVEYEGAGHGYIAERFEEDLANVMEFAASHSPVPA